MDIELISFKLCPFVQRAAIVLCPFVQRAAIVLHFKQIPFRLKHVDLADPPDWFRAISPFGKVPVLRVDGTTVVFESAVINEFLDEVTPGRLLPEEPLERAVARGRIELTTACCPRTRWSAPWPAAGSSSPRPAFGTAATSAWPLTATRWPAKWRSSRPSWTIWRPSRRPAPSSSVRTFP
jgi:glutathione S-transferase